MLRSLWSGVTGLTTHQTKMDVIGNNIANVNTTSYKSQAAGFQDILYQTRKDAYAATDTNGAVSPAQIGLGTRLSSVFTNITEQGSAMVTDNPYDLMITGDAFFVVQPDGSDATMAYTRDGSFTVDGDGYLVTKGQGHYVQGATQNGNTTILDRIRVVNYQPVVDPDGAVRMRDTVPGTATTEAQIKGNLNKYDKNLVEGEPINLQVYGSDGNPYDLKLVFNDAGDLADNTYAMSIESITDQDGKEIELGVTRSLFMYYGANDGELKAVAPYTFLYYSDTKETKNAAGGVNSTSFKLNGSMIGQSYYTKTVTGTDGKEYKLNFSIEEDTSGKGDYTFKLQSVSDENGNETEYSGNSLLFDYDNNNGKLKTIDGKNNKRHTFSFTNDKLPIGPVTVDFSDTEMVVYGDKDYTFRFTGEASKLGPLHMDFTYTTNYAARKNASYSTLKADRGDVNGKGTGYSKGVLNRISFANDGSIYGEYSNGQSVLKAKLAFAEFSNAMGLEKSGDNLYTESPNSGDAQFVDITSSGGYISSGVLEGSNVDLAAEFTDMITTQRGFQANSKVITTSDEMLQVLRDLKR